MQDQKKFDKRNSLKIGFGFLSLALILSGLSVFSEAAGEAETFEVKTYGHVELDAIYSSRNTNPLDPAQFNGYLTAAGPGENDSSTFNSRFLLLGVKSEWKCGELSIIAQGEFDFWGSDAVGLQAPRLRLAKIQYGTDSLKLIVGQDWTPIMTLHPSALDFSIMGYGGNLWQRIPQITFKQHLDFGMEYAVTIMRFERGSFAGPFGDQMRMPFIGARVGYKIDKILVALSGAYRQGKLAGINQEVTSNLIGLEASAPLGPVTLSLEIAQGQGLGAEFFRFGQDFNGSTAIKTIVGWADLSYAIEKWVMHAGYGIDDPEDGDLTGVANFSNYLKNERIYANLIYTLTGGFKIGAEYTYAATAWSNLQTLYGNQVMLSFFYDF